MPYTLALEELEHEVRGRIVSIKEIEVWLKTYEPIITANIERTLHPDFEGSFFNPPCLRKFNQFCEFQLELLNVASYNTFCKIQLDEYATLKQDSPQWNLWAEKNENLMLDYFSSFFYSYIIHLDELPSSTSLIYIKLLDAELDGKEFEHVFIMINIFSRLFMENKILHKRFAIEEADFHGRHLDLPAYAEEYEESLISDEVKAANRKMIKFLLGPLLDNMRQNFDLSRGEE